MNLDDRVRSFLESWPLIEKNLNRILEEGVRNGNDIFNGSRSGGLSQVETFSSLSES